MKQFIKLGTNLVSVDAITCVQLGQNDKGQKVIAVRLEDGHNIVLRAESAEDAEQALARIADILAGRPPADESIEAEVSDL